MSCSTSLAAVGEDLPARLLQLLPKLVLVLALLTTAEPSRADLDNALAALEDPAHPLLQVSTARGNFFVELLPEEAPANAGRVLALAQGEVTIEDPRYGFSFNPRYYDGMRFHRVIPGFVIQAGSPAYNPLGSPGELLADEINAEALGLHRQPVLAADGQVNALLDIDDREEFSTQILEPLLQDMDIDDPDALEQAQQDVLERLQNMSLLDLYAAQGYNYRRDLRSRPIRRGIVAMANQGPDSNGPEFFIALSDAPWLDGRHTVIGRVVDGMDVVDAIGSVAIEPERFSRLSTAIYAVEQVNPAMLSTAPDQ